METYTKMSFPVSELARIIYAGGVERFPYYCKLGFRSYSYPTSNIRLVSCTIRVGEVFPSELGRFVLGDSSNPLMEFSNDILTVDEDLGSDLYVFFKVWTNLWFSNCGEAPDRTELEADICFSRIPRDFAERVLVLGYIPSDDP